MLRAMLSFTCLALLFIAAPVQSQQGPEETAIRSFVESYDAAFKAKDLEKLASFYHPDVTIFEGGGVNRGWADYRDHHLGPELKEFQDLEFSHLNVSVHLLGDGSAYVASEYHIKAKMKEREIDSGGLETLILVKADDGRFQIRHAHTSSRRRPQQPSQP